MKTLISLLIVLSASPLFAEEELFQDHDQTQSVEENSADVEARILMGADCPNGGDRICCPHGVAPCYCCGGGRPGGRY